MYQLKKQYVRAQITLDYLKQIGCSKIIVAKHKEMINKIEKEIKHNGIDFNAFLRSKEFFNLKLSDNCWRRLVLTIEERCESCIYFNEKNMKKKFDDIFDKTVTEDKDFDQKLEKTLKDFCKKKHDCFSTLICLDFTQKEEKEVSKIES